MDPLRAEMEGILLSKQPISNFSRVLSDGIHSLSSLFLLGNETSSKGLISVEINLNYIKILQIKNHAVAPEVRFFSITPIPEGSIVKDEVKNASPIINILKETYARFPFATHNVALAIPRSAAIIKNITVDKRLDEDEIESRVWIEANRFFPNLIGDIYLDFVVTGPSAQDASQLEVILVACRKEQINPYLELIRQSGLTPKIVDVNSYALERAFALVIKQSSSPSVALLNITFSLITLIVIHEGQLVYAHELTYDGRNLVPRDIEALEASQNTQYDALKANLSLHLRHSMQFFYSSRPNIRINELYLSGDCAVAIPDLTSFIRDETGKETILADPFKNMSFAQMVDQVRLHRYAPALMLCCGLALSRIDQ